MVEAFLPKRVQLTVWMAAFVLQCLAITKDWLLRVGSTYGNPMAILDYLLETQLLVSASRVSTNVINVVFMYLAGYLLESNESFHTQMRLIKCISICKHFEQAEYHLRQAPIIAVILLECVLNKTTFQTCRNQ